MVFKDGGSPDARLRLASLGLARLRLNDGAKLWVSFKLCYKTNNFYHTYWRGSNKGVGMGIFYIETQHDPQHQPCSNHSQLQY